MESGVYTTAPGYNFLSGIVKDHGGTIHRKLGVSCVDVVTGSYVLFDETTPNLALAMLSSSSIPFIFPYQEWPNGVYCMDGGTVWNTNLATAINRCRE